jgi:hypothetical protein
MTASLSHTLKDPPSASVAAACAHAFEIDLQYAKTMAASLSHKKKRKRTGTLKDPPSATVASACADTTEIDLGGDDYDSKKKKAAAQQQDPSVTFGESSSLATCDDESEDDVGALESFPYKSVAEPKSMNFVMKDAFTKPIRWKSPNGSHQTAVRIPCAGTRMSFRKSAQQTQWIEQVTESMLKHEKVLPEVGVEWLIEALFERHRPQFESFCERKGYLLPTTARMPEGKSAAKVKYRERQRHDHVIVTGHEAAKRDSLERDHSL